MADLSPAAIMRRLEEIERDLAIRQNALEEEAQIYHNWVAEVERLRAVEYLKTSGTVEERKSKVTAEMGQCAQWDELKESTAKYEALKAAVKVLTTRASIAQSLLKAMTDQVRSG